MRLTKYLLIASIASLAFAGAASAETISTPATIAAVTVTEEEIDVPAFPASVGSSASCKQDTGGKGTACYVRFSDSPEFFRGANLCISGLDLNWAVKRDGTVVTGDPMRRAYCSPIGDDGRASVASGYNLANGVPFIERGGRIIAWASRADLR